ncbi:MAG: ThuA domain-containing protein [Filimonas sp.]|nr:ThuA domain-containing protein [Filimonas sp.]
MKTIDLFPLAYGKYKFDNLGSMFTRNSLSCTCCLVLILCFLSFAGKAQVKSNRILVFSKTEGGYRHASIAAGKMMFLRFGEKYKLQIDTTEDASHFNDKELKQYSAIVFLSTRGNVFDSAQQEAFVRYIHSGGGIVGIHAATTTEYDWPWFNKLIGAYFDGHPVPQMAHYTVIDKNFPATKNLPDTFSMKDEIYNFKSVQDSLRYLITVDERSYTGGKMGTFHPIAWYNLFEHGRVFYTALGHFDAAYEDPLFTEMILQGLYWAMGKQGNYFIKK